MKKGVEIKAGKHGKCIYAKPGVQREAVAEQRAACRRNSCRVRVTQHTTPLERLHLNSEVGELKNQKRLCPNQKLQCKLKGLCLQSLCVGPQCVIVGGVGRKNDTI